MGDCNESKLSLDVCEDVAQCCSSTVIGWENSHWYSLWDSRGSVEGGVMGQCELDRYAHLDEFTRILISPVTFNPLTQSVKRNYTTYNTEPN